MYYSISTYNHITPSFPLGNEIEDEESFIHTITERQALKPKDLTYAAQKGYNRAIRLLRDRKIEFSGEEIAAATVAGHDDTVDILMEMQAPCCEMTLQIIGDCRLDLIHRVVDYGAKPENCLTVAFQKGRVDVVEYFLNKGYIPSQNECRNLEICKSNQTALFAMLDLLSRFPETAVECLAFLTYVKDEQQQKILDEIFKHESTKKHAPKCFNRMIAGSKDKSKKDLKLGQQLIDHGCLPNTENVRHAVEQNQFKTAIFLVENGAPVTEKLLEFCCMRKCEWNHHNDQLQLVKTIIAKGIPPTGILLNQALMAGNSHIFEYFVELHVSLDEINLKELIQNDDFYRIQDLKRFTNMPIKYVDLITIPNQFHRDYQIREWMNVDSHLDHFLMCMLFYHLHEVLPQEKTLFSNDFLKWIFKINRDLHHQTVNNRSLYSYKHKQKEVSDNVANMVGTALQISRERQISFESAFILLNPCPSYIRWKQFIARSGVEKHLNDKAKGAFNFEVFSALFPFVQHICQEDDISKKASFICIKLTVLFCKLGYAKTELLFQNVLEQKNLEDFDKAIRKECKEGIKVSYEELNAGEDFGVLCDLIRDNNEPVTFDELTKTEDPITEWYLQLRLSNYIKTEYPTHAHLFTDKFLADFIHYLRKLHANQYRLRDSLERHSNVSLPEIIQEGFWISRNYRIPLFEAFVLALPGTGPERWTLFFPNFHVDRTINNYSPYGFNPAVYAQLLPVMQEIAEKEYNSHEICQQTYKLTVLCGSFDNAMHFISRAQASENSADYFGRPIHDACLFELPCKGAWDISKWSAWVNSGDKERKSMLPFAATIDRSIHGQFPGFNEQTSSTDEIAYYQQTVMQYFNGLPSGPAVIEEWNAAEDPLSKNEILWKFSQTALPYDWKRFQRGVKASKIPEKIRHTSFFETVASNRRLSSYSINELWMLVVGNTYVVNEEKFQRLAHKFFRAKVPTEYFKMAISILNNPTKTFDLLPDVTVKHEKYTFKKVPANSPEMFTLGIDTECCQRLDGAARRCVEHGATSPYGGFYGVYEGNKLRGQSWSAWSFSNDENGMESQIEVTLDSLERIPQANIEVLIAIYKKAAREMIDKYPLITRVTLGASGKTPQFDVPIIKNPQEQMVGFESKGFDSSSKRYILFENDKNHPVKEIKLSHLLIMPGTDTFINKKKKLNTLAVHPIVRQKFLQKRPKAWKLLLDKYANPLVEEGSVNYSRQRIGELFLTHKAVELLANRLFKSVPGHRFLSFDNHLTLDCALELNDGQSYSVLITQDVHSMTAYLEKSDDQIRCFLFDPEHLFDHEFARRIVRIFPDIHLIRMTAKLQKDYYSCSTMSYQSLLLYAKKGKMLFREIDKPENLKRNREYFDLLPEKTPVELLKMSQDYQLPDEALDIEVEEGLTMRAYLKQNQLLHNGTVYNVSAILEKYSLIDELNAILEEEK